MPFSLYKSIVDSLEEQIAVIDRGGNIIAVNTAWLTFGSCNGQSPDIDWIGVNYLDSFTDALEAGDDVADAIFHGIRDVISGRQSSFTYDYPCHSPDKQRWFTLRAATLLDSKRAGYFVVSHHDITELVLAEQQLAQMANRDPLTGLGNRRALEEFLDREIRHCTRRQLPLSMALIDVDYFKQYNDEHGHLAGDNCLSQISRVLSDHSRRATDLAARLGGDEFILVFSDTDDGKVQDIMSSVLDAINALNLHFGEGRKVTASIGLFTAVPDSSCDEASLVERADEALYRAKLNGRNQIAVAA